MSAPVSRETSGGSYNGGYGGSSPSRIRLTQAQAEMARLSGISEREYAENLLKLNQMKADGSYMERR